MSAHAAMRATVATPAAALAATIGEGAPQARPAITTDTAARDVFAPLLDASADQLWGAIDRTSVAGHAKREFEAWVRLYKASANP